MNSKKCRVLIVGPDRMDPGGVAGYYNAVYPRLQRDDLELEYLEIGSTKGNNRPLHFLRDQIIFWNALTQRKPDIVHLNPSLDLRSFLRDSVFAIVSRLLKRKMLVFFHGWQRPFAKKLKGPLKLVFFLGFAKADATIVLAREFERELKAWGLSKPVFLGTTAVENDLLNGFSITWREQQLSGLLSDKRKLKILYLSRLEKEKGILELVEAVRALSLEGREVSLTVAGTGPAYDELEARILKMGGTNTGIRLVGYVRGAQKAEILRSHDLFCFPTRYGEGMPTAVLEAMSFGLPVITCPVGGLADFFEDEAMGALLQNTSPEAISRAITGLMEAPSKLSQIARFNYEYASEHFLASRTADFIRQRYVGILQQKD